MTIALGNQLQHMERLVAAAGTMRGRRIAGTVTGAKSVSFAIDEPNGTFVIEAETDRGRTVWAKIDFK